ncbi:MAG: MarR family transcriptional regulator [Planctomycetes bacterium]|nr:MarR family transcriptional regulator [Planctomycetota bacterium]
MPREDLVDHIITQWAKERPELDTSGFAVVGRLLILGRVLERRVKATLAGLDLELWAFDVLATLRRQGSPYELASGELSRAVLLSPGAMTNRVDRLEASGLVTRVVDPHDRRGVRVRLTAAGRVLVDRALGLRFDEATAAVESLPDRDRATLVRLLRKLGLALGD